MNKSPKLKPQQVIIETTSRCNLKCKLCPSLEDPRHLDFPVEMYHRILQRILEETPDTVVIPWNNGEPFLHPEYLTMLELTRKHGLKYYVTTNGTILNKALFDEILGENSTAYQLIFSLDGLPHQASSTIETARPGTNRKQVLETIEWVLKRKQELNSTVDIALKICERGQDWEEIEKYIQYWLQRKGVNYVCLGKALGAENPKSMRLFPCQYSDNKFMVIKSDGRVVPCAYNVEATKGDLINFGTYDGTGSILDFYNNEKFQEFRSNQQHGIFCKPCDTCGYAYTGSGFEGSIKFRKGSLAGKTVYHKRDYYNSFFSLEKKTKKVTFYTEGKVGV